MPRISCTQLWKGPRVRPSCKQGRMKFRERIETTQEIGGVGHPAIGLGIEVKNATRLVGRLRVRVLLSRFLWPSLRRVLLRSRTLLAFLRGRALHLLNRTLHLRRGTLDLGGWRIGTCWTGRCTGVGRVAPGGQDVAALAGLVPGAPRGPAVPAGQERDVPAPSRTGRWGWFGLSCCGAIGWLVGLGTCRIAGAGCGVGAPREAAEPWPPFAAGRGSLPRTGHDWCWLPP